MPSQFSKLWVTEAAFCILKDRTQVTPNFLTCLVQISLTFVLTLFQVLHCNVRCMYRGTILSYHCAPKVLLSFFVNPKTLIFRHCFEQHFNLHCYILINSRVLSNLFFTSLFFTTTRLLHTYITTGNAVQ